MTIFLKKIKKTLTLIIRLKISSCIATNCSIVQDFYHLNYSKKLGQSFLFDNFAFSLLFKQNQSCSTFQKPVTPS
jgi:hypothetical protein